MKVVRTMKSLMKLRPWLTESALEKVKTKPKNSTCAFNYVLIASDELLRIIF